MSGSDEFLCRISRTSGKAAPIIEPRVDAVLHIQTVDEQLGLEFLTLTVDICAERVVSLPWIIIGDAPESFQPIAVARAWGQQRVKGMNGDLGEE